MDLDKLFPFIGEYEKYQKLLLWLVILPHIIPNSFVTFNQLFMADTPEHWCRVPALEKSFDAENRKLFGIPKLNGFEDRYEKCVRYAVNWTHILQENPNLYNFEPNASWPLQGCLDGWEYNLTDVSSSIVIDFNLVCDKSMYPTYGLVMLNLGGSLGVFTFGLINDKYGRKLAFTICMSIAIISNTLTAFSPNVIFWMITRLILGLIMPAFYHIIFIFVLEMVGPNYRARISLLVGLIFSVGLMLLALLTYLIPDWRIMTIVTSIPFFPIFVTWWFIPESPRWLIATKKNEQARIVLKTIAKINKKPIPDSLFLTKETTPLKTSSDEITKLRKSVGILDLYRTPNMRLKTLLIAFIWFVNEIVYNGLNYYGPSLGNESHLSFFLSGLMEIPGTIVCLLYLDVWGRKFPLSILMIISGVSCMLTIIFPQEAQMPILILFLISKFGIAASFLVLYTFAGEIFPTEARGIGLAMSAYLSGLGRIFVPFINNLGSGMLVLPLIILGSISVLGGILTLRLPETLHQSLPQTIEEGEAFGKDWSSLASFHVKSKKASDPQVIS